MAGMGEKSYSISQMFSKYLSLSLFCLMLSPMWLFCILPSLAGFKDRGLAVEALLKSY